jgi:enoyl-CoA hydratase
MSAAAPLDVSRAGPVGILELARPEKFNSLSIAVTESLQVALDAFEAPGSGIRAVLVRAQGKNFCTGADLDEVLGLRGDADEVRRFIGPAHRALRRLEASPLPVVAACQGLALAGGLELMMACDVVFAAADARFGDQHAQYGLLPGFGGSQRLPRIVGVRRALDLFFSARWIDAETALRWGLVNHVVPPDALADAALDYCHMLATRSRPGLAMMKRLARAGLEGSLDAGLALEEGEVVDGLLHDDASEGLAAFRGRRAPRFQS